MNVIKDIETMIGPLTMFIGRGLIGCIADPSQARVGCFPDAIDEIAVRNNRDDISALEILYGMRCASADDPELVKATEIQMSGQHMPSLRWGTPKAIAPIKPGLDCYLIQENYTGSTFLYAISMDEALTLRDVIESTEAFDPVVRNGRCSCYFSKIALGMGGVISVRRNPADATGMGSRVHSATIVKSGRGPERDDGRPLHGALSAGSPKRAYDDIASVILYGAEPKGKSHPRLKDFMEEGEYCSMMMDMRL